MKDKKSKKKIELKKHKFSRKYGLWLMIIGLAMQFLNIITYGYWGIDIDILGAALFIVGLVITILRWKIR